MKHNLTSIRTLAIVMAGIILFISCTSTTRIVSEPSGALVYLDEERAGTTPYTMKDTKITGTCTSVRLEKEGYEELQTVICRNEEVDAGAIVGGLFFFFPFLWTMKYKPSHVYELTALSDSQVQQQQNENETSTTETKAEKLRELKALYDDGILTKEEYEEEKKKILDQ